MTDPVELQVLHGSERYLISLPITGQAIDAVTVKELAQKVEEVSGVPILAQRLINKGRSLTDLNASLESYGIGIGSKIMLLGNRPNTLYDSEEFQAICKVEKNVTSLEHKLDEIACQSADLQKGFMEKEMACEVLGKLSTQLKVISEDFMKLLEQLDAMTFAENQKEARMKRKSIVERIQKLLRKTDEVTGNIETFCASKTT